MSRQKFFWTRRDLSKAIEGPGGWGALERSRRLKWALVIAVEALIVLGLLWFLVDSVAWRLSVVGVGVVFLCFLVGLVVAPSGAARLLPKVLAGIFGLFVVVYVILLVVAMND